MFDSGIRSGEDVPCQANQRFSMSVPVEQPRRRRRHDSSRDFSHAIPEIKANFFEQLHDPSYLVTEICLV